MVMLWIQWNSIETLKAKTINESLVNLEWSLPKQTNITSQTYFFCDSFLVQCCHKLEVQQTIKLFFRKKSSSWFLTKEILLIKKVAVKKVFPPPEKACRSRAATLDLFCSTRHSNFVKKLLFYLVTYYTQTVPP